MSVWGNQPDNYMFNTVNSLKEKGLWMKHKRIKLNNSYVLRLTNLISVQSTTVTLDVNLSLLRMVFCFRVYRPCMSCWTRYIVKLLLELSTFMEYFIQPTLCDFLLLFGFLSECSVTVIMSFLLDNLLGQQFFVDFWLGKWYVGMFFFSVFLLESSSYLSVIWWFVDSRN